jgi:hypothetical protein
MPDHLVVCWVASTPSTRVWRHPCVVLAAQLVLRHLMHLAYLVRTKLPRMAADALARGLRQLARARAVRRLKHKASGAASLGSLSRSSSWSLDAVPGPGGGGNNNGGASGASTSRAVRSGGGAGPSSGAAGAPTVGAAGRPAGQAKRAAGKAAVGVDLPLEILQRLGPWLSGADMGSARLTCRSWRDCLGAQVSAAVLPPLLWQHAARGQLSQLRRLTAAFPLLRAVHCSYERGAPVDARSMRRTMGLLARTTPTLAALRLRGMVDAPNWPALAEGLAPLAPQLAALDLGDVCWPDACSMAALGASLQGLRRLRLHSSVFSRLTARHVDVIASMGTLRDLSLVGLGAGGDSGMAAWGRCMGLHGGCCMGAECGSTHPHFLPPPNPTAPQGFRTVDGTSSCPMALDPLTRLSRLSALDLEYTGLLELSSGVGFRRPEALSALTALTSLSVRLVPLPILDGLAALPALLAFHFVQMAPVSARQADALARCAALARLELEPLPWELLPALGRLSRLRVLSVHLHQVQRGGLPPHAADAMLALAPLSKLQSLMLAGQIELGERHIRALAAAWPCLRTLDLCCGLAAGTSGFAALAALRRLRLSPYHWDVWSNEPPLLLHPAELPEGLTCLEARDVWVAAPGPDAARLGAARLSDFSWSVGVCPAARRAGGGGAFSAYGAASSASGSSGTPDCGSGTCGLGVDCACVHSHDGDASDCDSLFWEQCHDPDLMSSSAVAIVTGTRWLVPPAAAAGPHAAALPPLSASERAAALTLSTPRLRRLVLRCVGAPHGDDNALPLPGLGRLAALEELDLHHCQITARDLEAITTSPAARRLRALRLVVLDDGAAKVGSGLTKLTRLTALESLQVRNWVFQHTYKDGVRLGWPGAGLGLGTSSFASPPPPTHTCHPHPSPPTPITRTPLKVHAHERALNRRVRAAIATMAALRRLTLVTSPDFPASFASGLLVLTRLRQLAVLRVGLGFGAMDALRWLHGCVARALPGCHFEMLSDVDSLLEDEEDDDADAAARGGADGKGGENDDDEGAARDRGAAARARGPRYIRLMRTSWGG